MDFFSNGSLSEESWGLGGADKSKLCGSTLIVNAQRHTRQGQLSRRGLRQVAAVDEPKLHLWETGVMRITRHPQTFGQALWCLAHTLWIGSSFMVATTGALMAHHLFSCWHGDFRLRRKYGQVGPPPPASIFYPCHVFSHLFLQFSTLYRHLEGCEEVSEGMERGS